MLRAGEPVSLPGFENWAWQESSTLVGILPGWLWPPNYHRQDISDRTGLQVHFIF
jgi:hypothetical protein